MTLSLLVQGWRGISHSYAIVNQWQLLSLARRTDVDLRVEELPLLHAAWAAAPHPFDARERALLDDIERITDDFVPDVTYRIAFPFDFTLPAAGRLAVFGTSEAGTFPVSLRRQFQELAKSSDDGRLIIVTPSQWSADGFRAAGVPGGKIHVVPHGVDTGIFRPAGDKARIRAGLGLEGFVFFHAGSMTANKGLRELLQAFAAVAARHADCRLLLKGSDSLYGSSSFVNQALAQMATGERSLVSSRLVYGGNAVSMSRMTELYGAADAYVSPYLAEGFNMPVLEAAACGLPVICTGGGATDEFVAPGFARTIGSRVVATEFDGAPGRVLQPDHDHLVELMLRVIVDRDWQASARNDGPRHVAANYAWDRVVDRLIAVLAGRR